MKKTTPRIEIDRGICDREGLCAQVCPWVLGQESPNSVPTVAHPHECILCGHCVAVCPTGAITHLDMDAKNFLPTQPGQIVSPDTLQLFLRRRRSVRNYNQRRKVKRSVVEKMIGVARYSPTGCNVQSLVHMVVQDRETIAELVRLTIDYFRVQVEIAEDKDARQRLDPDEMRALEECYPIYREQIREYDAGKDILFFNAPGLVVTHAPREMTPCPMEDATLASFHMMLIASSLGLGTCYIGNFHPIANKIQPIRTILGVPPADDVLMTFTFGYPSVRFRRLVDRKVPKVIWMGAE